MSLVRQSYRVCLLAAVVAVMMRSPAPRLAADEMALIQQLPGETLPPPPDLANAASAVTMYPWPLWPQDPNALAWVFGYPPSPWQAAQPRGHEITFTGPNSYIYRPIFEGGSGGLDALAQARAAAVRVNARRLFESALWVFRRGDNRQALIELDRLASEGIDDGLCHLLRVQIEFSLSNYSDALQSLRAAMERLSPDEWGTFVVDHAEFYPSVTRFRRRLESLEDFVRSQPELAEARQLLGYFYGFLGYREAALAQLEAARELRADDPLTEALIRHFSPDDIERDPDDLDRIDAGAPVDRPRGPREF